MVDSRVGSSGDAKRPPEIKLWTETVLVVQLSARQENCLPTNLAASDMVMPEIQNSMCQEKCVCMRDPEGHFLHV
jgi:hypothetical protein